MDVQRFDEILSDDFVCSNPDGSLVGRAAFLEQTARPIAISGLEARDVDVRLMGDFAIIHARTTYNLPDGRPGAGRYTDIWATRNGQWLASPRTSRAARRANGQRARPSARERDPPGRVTRSTPESRCA